jgi:hypothetical protein
MTHCLENYSSRIIHLGLERTLVFRKADVVIGDIIPIFACPG